MANFAEIDANNLVTRVVVVPNDQADNGQDYLANVIGLGGTWIQTSYNGTIRYNFAGIGYTYDPVADAFIEPQPYPSWTLDTSTYRWVAPVPYPTDGQIYGWNEETLSWVVIS